MIFFMFGPTLKHFFMISYFIFKQYNGKNISLLAVHIIDESGLTWQCRKSYVNQFHSIVILLKFFLGISLNHSNSSFFIFTAREMPKGQFETLFDA